MSGILANDPFASTLSGLPLGDQIASVLFSSQRMIGTLFPGIVAEEEHTDTMAITEHPVELGATITDHAYKQPARLRMKLGWSNSSIAAFLSFQGDSFVSQVYQQFLNMQLAAQLITVVTGKRLYQNMLVEEITVRTDEKSEYALDVEAVFREVILASVVTTPLPSLGAMLAMTAPQDNAPTQAKGLTNLIPASPNASILYEILKASNGL